MYVSPCPICGRQPKINRNFVGISLAIYCPNLCSGYKNGEWIPFQKATHIVHTETVDDNTLYREWNELVTGLSKWRDIEIYLIHKNALSNKEPKE